MQSDHELADTVRSWLRTDRHESADRVLADVLALLDTNTQQRAWWPSRRIVPGKGVFKLALTAAAVVVVALVAIDQLPAGRGIVGNGATSSPTSSPSTTATPLPSPMPTPAEVDPRSADYSIGRHSLTVDGIRFSFAVPAPRWEPFGSLHISKSTVGPQGAEAIVYWAGFPDGADADPCGISFPPVHGLSAADLADALSPANGTELIAGPSDVTLGGRSAKHVVLKVRDDVGCDPGFFYNWKARTGGAMWEVTRVGDIIRVWVVDVDGQLLFIAGVTNKDAGPGLDEEIGQIVGSIQFE